MNENNGFSALIVFRASLLTGSAGRVGERLPGMSRKLREWCFHSRARRDFILLLLASKLEEGKETESSIRQQILISRNTMKSIIGEAEAFNMVVQKEGREVSITAGFCNSYLESYLREFELIDQDSAKTVSATFRNLAKKFEPIGVEEATRMAIELSVHARAESIKADRLIKLSNIAEGDKLDLSTWAVMNSFNRDLLLLLMSAAITGRNLSIAEIMRRMHVSRNSAKTSLRYGVVNGFINAASNGYSCSAEALKAYLNWHGAVFSTYSDRVLSALAVFYDHLSNEK